jgi:hypothetical protein
MQWLFTIAMGLWAVWTWSHERDRERLTERGRLAALYVNPFLSACEDLQSRIYHILELEGLRTLRKRYPDGGYAEEVLYLIARYFGWVVVLSRYSPYAQDPEVIRLGEAVRDAFASTGPEFPVGPFNFFHPEQKALGKMVMTRTEGPQGSEFDTISSYEFKERLASPALSGSRSVQQSLEALDSAEDAEHLAGRKRLETAQHHLVDLLQYLEASEGYSFFTGERKKVSSRQPHTPLNGSRRIRAGDGPSRVNGRARASRGDRRREDTRPSLRSRRPDLPTRSAPQ